MQFRLLRIAFGAVLVLTGYAVGAHTAPAIHAEMKITIPAQYGRVIAGDSSSLWFEDSSGTLRQVTIPSGNTVFTLTRQK